MKKGYLVCWNDSHGVKHSEGYYDTREQAVKAAFKLKKAKCWIEVKILIKRG